MTMIIRERLHELDDKLYGRFLAIADICAPILETIDRLFPDFTRHDPSHVEKLEGIVSLILKENALKALTAMDLFVLLSSLWAHDTGMGILPKIRARYSSNTEFQESLQVFYRKGLNEDDCWREFARKHHHDFCPSIVSEYLADLLTPFEAHWIGEIARSHGERTLHEHARWPKRLAVGNGVHICPSVLAVCVRLADILHLNEARAPEYLLEHRKIQDLVSVGHWRAHQVAADFTIMDGSCFFDGVTDDDEAYWYAQQFFNAMDQELAYCRREVLPLLDPPFSESLTFARVEGRIVPNDFVPESKPLRLEVNGYRLLKDLLGDALYAGKPAWFRELIQNAFDACRDRKQMEPMSEPSIEIQFNTTGTEISITDTGIGMTAEIVRKYFLVAGSSYWSSAEYLSTHPEHVGHVGTFGVGFMSVFAVAEQVTVSTRHYQEEVGRLYLIRSPGRIVRTENRRDLPVGTRIKLKVAHEAILQMDPEQMLRETCPFPEFPLNLLVDDDQLASFPCAAYPTVENGPRLTQIDESARQTKLLATPINEPGIKGTLHVPLIYLEALNAHVPDMRGWVRQAGWRWEGESSTHLGGVKYQTLHAISGKEIFMHLPSIGAFRVSISPSNFAPEMNLSRDSFVSGPGTRRLHALLCEVVDRVLSEDLELELNGGKSDSLRSAIVARYSGSLLHLWLGQVPSLGTWLGRPDLCPEPANHTPFHGLTSVAERELRFGLLDNSRRLQYLTILELKARDSVIFSPGILPSGHPPEAVMEAIWDFDNKAMLLVTLPDPSFGTLELRHWAIEEFLVPVLSHGRCAYGVRLAFSDRPYPFFPTELAPLGLPVASGPSHFAILDYRDLMAEVKNQPTGGPDITAVLNRRNPAIAALISKLSEVGITDLRMTIGQLRHRLWKSLTLGTKNEYFPEAGISAIDVMIQLGQVFGLELGRESLTYPTYHDGGRAIPFGRFSLPNDVLQSLRELERFEAPFMHLS